MDVSQLALGGQTVKNLRRLTCKFDLDQSERKSSQVNVSARKPWPNGVASRRKLKTWVHLRLRVARALQAESSNLIKRS